MVLLLFQISTIMTFLQTRNEAPLWLFSFFSNLHHDDFSPRTKLRHHYDFSHFLGPKLQRQFLGWKNALIPQLIDSDGRALYKDSESGPNSKITKITNRTFLQNTAELNVVVSALLPTTRSVRWSTRTLRSTWVTWSTCSATDHSSWKTSETLQHHTQDRSSTEQYTGPLVSVTPTSNLLILDFLKEFYIW